MCLNITSNRVCVGVMKFLLRMVWKK